MSRRPNRRERRAVARDLAIRAALDSLLAQDRSDYRALRRAVVRLRAVCGRYAPDLRLPEVWSLEWLLPGLRLSFLVGRIRNAAAAPLIWGAR